VSPEPLSRRSALWGAAVAGGAGVAGFVVARGSHAADASTTAAANDYGADAAPGRLLTQLDELPAGGGVVLTDEKVVLVRAQDGTVRAFSAVCTHQGCPVTDVVDGVIVCPCHASQFDAATGEVVSGPARRPLPPVDVEVRDDGVFTT
jgi:Rieske Fe-S protein